MYTRSEIDERITYLRNLEPVKGRKPLDDLEAAIVTYLTRDAEFELQVHKTLDKVVADEFHHGLIYEHDELLDPWREVVPRSSAPAGYEYLGDLFKCVEVFAEIMSVADLTFKNAFYRKVVETETADTQTTQTVWANKLVDDWLLRLQSSPANEINGLKAIMQFCANRSYNLEYALIFEELGECIVRHPIRYYAKAIYVTKGYGWLIEIFNLRMYRPSYLAELPNWEEPDESEYELTPVF